VAVGEDRSAPCGVFAHRRAFGAPELEVERGHPVTRREQVFGQDATDLAVADQGDVHAAGPSM
jgi:hypothetical protein